MMAAIIKTLIASCLILAACTSRTGVKTDFKPYADTCDTCYNKLLHIRYYIPTKRLNQSIHKTERLSKNICKTALGRNCSDGIGTGEERGKPVASISV